MAVHTVLETSQIQRLIAGYELGKLHTVTPVAEGIENTNYFVSLEPASTHSKAAREFLLTIFEHLKSGELAFYIHWLDDCGPRQNQA